MQPQERQNLNVYRAYALTIHSDVPLHLPAGGGGGSDITIARRSLWTGEASEVPEDAEKTANWMHRSNSGSIIAGRIYDEVRFLVKDGQAIYYDLNKELAEGVLQSYLLGVLMATLLRQRGYLVLHACAVAKDGNAVAFAGESGWGKSTLAEYFCQQGYQLLSDDVLAIDTDPGKDSSPLVLPGYPQIRLRANAGRYLRPDFDALPLVNMENRKRFTTPSAFLDKSVSLQQLYLLEPSFAETTHIEAVPKRTALLRLISHARATNLLEAPSFRARLFRQCERVLEHVSVQRLQRARDLDGLSEIVDLVEHDLNAPSSARTASVEAPLS